MKTNKLNLFVAKLGILGIFMILATGCKKNVNEQPIEKDYDYFARTLRNDSRIQALAVEYINLADIMRTTALHSKNSSNEKNTASIKTTYSNQEVQTKEQITQIFLSLGFSAENSEKFYQSQIIRMGIIQSFTRDNPEFLRLTLDQQKSLLIDAISINGKDKLKITGTKIKVLPGSCENSFQIALDTALFSWNIQMLVNDILFGVCLAALTVETFGSGSGLCIAGFAAASAGAYAEYQMTMNAADQNYLNCMYF